MASQAKVAVVTGGGRAVALALAAEGYAVVVAGRRPDALESTANEAVAGGHVKLPVPTHVRDPASVKALFTKTHDAFGRLDLMFNNAGAGSRPICTGGKGREPKALDKRLLAQQSNVDRTKKCVAPDLRGNTPGVAQSACRQFGKAIETTNPAPNSAAV